MIQGQGEVAFTIEYDQRTNEISVLSYAPLPCTNSTTTPASPPIDDSSVLSRLYLSACDTTQLFFDAGLQDISPSFDSLLFINDDHYVPSGIFSTSTDTPMESFAQIATRKGFLPKKKYKPVAQKVRSVVAPMPSHFRIERNIIGDPLRDMPELSPNPPPFIPTGRYTQERRDALHKQHVDFLWLQEYQLLDHFMCLHQDGFAWKDSERGKFRKDFFPPIEIPVIPHTPWIEKNIPLPPGIYEEVCGIIKKKLDSGVYESSNSSYRSRWFCVLKKDGNSLRIVHSLEPLNRVTIRHSGVTPIPEHIAEQFAS